MVARKGQSDVNLGEDGGAAIEETSPDGTSLNYENAGKDCQGHLEDSVLQGIQCSGLGK